MKNIVGYLQNENSEKLIIKMILENILYYQAINTNKKVEDFSGTLYNYFVHECVMNNQYIYLSKNEYNSIHNLYKELIYNLRALNINDVSYDDIKAIVKNHREKLIGIITSKADAIERDIIIPCSEYSADLQLKILRIDQNNISDPIIDIGCGKEAKLVKLLEKEHKNVYGIDQYYSKHANIICNNWLDFYFAPNTWGTIISHMAITNHFRRSITFKTDEMKQYMIKYKEILASLKIDGKFIYCPKIPEIEKALITAGYEITYYSNIDSNSMMDTVHVKKVRI